MLRRQRPGDALVKELPSQSSWTLSSASTRCPKQAVGLYIVLEARCSESEGEGRCVVVAWERCCLLPILTARPERGSSPGVPGARK
jgi:hypothetical protein